MKTSELCKIELYRFWHSKILFIGMVFACLGMFFLASDNTDVFLSDGTVIGNINSVMKFANLMLVLLLAVVISFYVGREFKLKTINHEVMAGYSLGKICLTKTLTCGLVVPLILLVCVLLFFVTSPVIFREYSLLRIILLFLMLCHISACTTLYVLLVRDGALGGCLAFVRFTLLEVLVLCVMMLGASEDLISNLKCMFVMSQWSVLISTNIDLPLRYIIGIVASTIGEYMLLMLIAGWYSKKTDF